MDKLVHGLQHFQAHVFRHKRELFRRLAAGQRPMALFITCSDSRVSPDLITQAEPGDIFVLRNAGNIVPPSPHSGGELATIEFAVVELGIRDVVVCGHSDCGAMKGLLAPDSISERLPAVARWLRHAERTKEIVDSEHQGLASGDILEAAIRENVLVQMENLRTHAFVRERVEQGKLRLHGWVYKFETGEVLHAPIAGRRA
jgi:carbonic anhydrase